MRPFAVTLAALAADASLHGVQLAASFDLVIAGGRVIDPESQRDAVAHVGISGGTIRAVPPTR